MKHGSRPPGLAPSPEWDGILREGERILWQGRPVPTLIPTPSRLLQAAFGLVFAAFAIHWITRAAQSDSNIWMFGLIHFAIGALMVLHGLLGRWWRLRYSFYTLTTQRAFLASDLPLIGRRLRDLPISPKTVVDFRSGVPGTLWLGWSEAGSGRQRLGFERIEEAEKVHRILRDVIWGKV